MSTQMSAAVLDPVVVSKSIEENPVVAAVREGLTDTPKWLPAWLFYDAEGSALFERITVLPEYYLTRTERAIFAGYADGIMDAAVRLHPQSDALKLRMLELGAGTASKTGVLLDAVVRRQGATDYLPIDVSETAIDEACGSIARTLQGVRVVPQVANYVTDALAIPPHDGPTLALYIGSSIGNFSPEEAVGVLCNLRAQLRPGDSLLLGTDLVKDADRLIAAYNDGECVTAAFNLNVLLRINRDLGANFDVDAFRHQAIWNAAASRMEMHLESLCAQTVRIASIGLSVAFAAGETIHTENSYKFTPASIAALLDAAGFRTVETWQDERGWFAVTLAAVTK
jgi:L-histidine N-alpha-methyltransferase